MVSKPIDLGHPPFMYAPSSTVLGEGCIWKKPKSHIGLIGFLLRVYKEDVLITLQAGFVRMS